MIIRIFILCLLASTSMLSQTQKIRLFDNPLNIPVSLSGTFGEVRTSHFHSGVDFRTQSTEGFPLFSGEAGYISRIKIETGGYGKALYINHNNGYTSVYAHMRSFTSAIDSLLKKKQYEKQSYSLDLSFNKGELVLKKRDLIGYSGNSGSSGGPHLHYEIRNSQTQKVINPLLFEFNVQDNTAPLVMEFFIYPQKGGQVNGSIEKYRSSVSLSSNMYSASNNDSIYASGTLCFGVEAFDRMGPSFKYGVYKIQLRINDSIIYAHQLDSFDFSESRYSNAFIDYEELVFNNKEVLLQYIKGNNKLSAFYTSVVNNGFYNIKDTGTYKVNYLFEDEHGNQSKLEYKIYGKAIRLAPLEIKTDSFYYAHDNHYKSKNVKIMVPKNALYNDIAFQYERIDSGSLNIYHKIHQATVPLHKSISISIMPAQINEAYKNKYLIFRINEKGKTEAYKSAWKANYLHCQSRSFGIYGIKLDTIAPEIVEANCISKGQCAGDTLFFTVKDNLSGIANYTLYVNNKWALLEYDPKNQLMYHVLDYFNYSKNSTIDVNIILSDGVGNENKKDFKIKIK